MATAFVFNLPYFGHINPCVPIVEALVSRAEQVFFYAPERFRHIVERSGATLRPFDFEESTPGKSLTTMVDWQLHVTEQCMPTLLKDAVRYGVSYVLVDYTCLWGRHFATHLKLPRVAIYTTFPNAFEHQSAAFSALREIYRAPDLLGTFLSFRRADRRVSKAFRVSRLRFPKRVVQNCGGDLNLVLCAPEMQPTDRAPAPGHHNFIGPCVRPVGYTQATALPALDERPLIYVSLGTFWTKQVEFFRACIDACADPAHQMLIAANDVAHRAELTSPADHIHVHAHVDQVAVLQRAALFVTHGGMNSVCEALLAGVPMLVFPQMLDQFELGKYVQRAGLGDVITSENLSAARIERMMRKILQDASMRERCREAGERLRCLGGPARAADLIFAHMESAGVRQPPLAGARPPSGICHTWAGI